MESQDNNNNDVVINHILKLEERLINENKEIKDQLKGLVEVNARFAQEIIALKNGSSGSNINGFGGTQEIATTPAVKKVKSNKVVLSVGETQVKITGNTYNHRSIFGENGASWSKADSAWMLPLDNKDSVIETLEEKGIEYTVEV
jgi:hypothetical protein